MSNYQTARTAAFKGLNRAPYIADGEMRSMKNLSSDAFPFLTTRKGREPYTFTTYIPSPEGEAYQDIERLPTPRMEEQGKVYRLTESALKTGNVYKYTGGRWEHQESSYSNGVLTDGENYTLLNGYRTLLVLMTSSSTPSVYTYADEKTGALARYLGEDAQGFKKYSVYRYVLTIWYDWKPYTAAPNDYDADVMPAPSLSRLGDRVTYRGETTEEFTNGQKYQCCKCYQGAWEEVECPLAVVPPEEPAEGELIQWGNTTGFISGSYYSLARMGTGDDDIAFVITDATDVYEETTYTPVASEENVGKIFLYSGINEGQFAKCTSDGNGAYVWTQVEHPEVARTVTLKDYLDNYEGCGMTKLLEIGAMNGGLTALFRDRENTAKLFYNKKLYEGINSLSEESGKKLVTVGNRLIVGESGSYLHEKDGGASFFSSGGAFLLSIEMVSRKYQSAAFSGERIYPVAYGNASSGKAYFELYSPIKLEKYYVPGENFKELAAALSIAGTGFCVRGKKSANSVKQYLKVASVTFETKRLMAGVEYADRLYIEADGVVEDFNWGKNSGDTLTFESTDEHFADVVAWKKRLWGYEKNVLHGTAADIFDENGLVDWTRGDNTYTESISQPIWQGGNITGITALREALVLFKEDSLTLVMGNYPAIMSSSTISCHGLSANNRRSVAVANESVFYLSYDGVYKFSGGVPECISRDAKITGTDAVGASDGNKYYLSLLENDGNYAMYVYDISLGLWHKEDDVRIISFVMIDGDMYGATETEIYNLNSQKEEEDWEAEFWYDEGTHRKKKYSGFHIRGRVGLSEVQIKADDGEWQVLCWTEDKFDFKFPPIECEEISIKIKGKGICEIKSLDRDYEVI